MDLSHLSGTELNFWVAKALEKDMPLTGQDKYGAPILAGQRSLSFLIQKYADFPQAWSPSTKWEDGGPIIERAGICIVQRDGYWDARMGALPNAYTDDVWLEDHGGSYGDTPLIAAMRAFVRSRLLGQIDD